MRNFSESRSLTNKERRLINNTRRARKNNTSRKRQNKHRNQMRGGQQIFINPIKNRPEITRCMRYQFTDLTGPAILYSSDLQKWCGFCTNTSTAFYNLSESVRLLRVGVTILANSSTGAAAAQFMWLGTNSPNQESIMYAAQGVPAKHSFYPPEDSLSYFWWDATSTTTPLCSIDVVNFTVEPIIYVDLEFQYVPGSGTMANHPLSIAATFTGIGYHLMFQNAASPVGLDAVS